MAKKKKARTAAQKAATKKMLAARKRSTKKAGKKKASRKRAATKKKVVNRKKDVPMAKKKRSKSGGEKKRARRRSGGGRGGFRMSGIMGTVKEGAIGIGGGLIAGIVSNKLPIADARIKAIAPVAAGLVLAATMGKRNKMFSSLATGMVILGGVAAIRNFFPNVPMLAGEEELVYLPDYTAGEEFDLTSGYDDDYDEDMSGPVEIADEPEYITPADL